MPRLYHHGAVDDLDEVIQFVLEKGFKEVYLIGYSMGGVQPFNYFGWTKMDERVKSGSRRKPVERVKKITAENAKFFYS